MTDRSRSRSTPPNLNVTLHQSVNLIPWSDVADVTLTGADQTHTAPRTPAMENVDRRCFRLILAPQNGGQSLLSARAAEETDKKGPAFRRGQIDQCVRRSFCYFLFLTTFPLYCEPAFLTAASNDLSLTFLLSVTTALSGMETLALVTPSTLESADCTFLTQPTPQVIPVIFS